MLCTSALDSNPLWTPGVPLSLLWFRVWLEGTRQAPGTGPEQWQMFFRARKTLVPQKRVQSKETMWLPSKKRMCISHCYLFLLFITFLQTFLYAHCSLQNSLVKCDILGSADLIVKDDFSHLIVCNEKVKEISGWGKESLLSQLYSPKCKFIIIWKRGIASDFSDDKGNSNCLSVAVHKWCIKFFIQSLHTLPISNHF